MAKRNSETNKNGKKNRAEAKSRATAFFVRALGALQDKGGPVCDLFCGQLALAIDMTERTRHPAEINAASTAARPLFQAIRDERKAGGQYAPVFTGKLIA